MLDLIPKISKAPSNNGVVELSDGQLRLLLLENLNPAFSIYNWLISLRFTGQLNIPVFEKALEYMFQRHEVFRTRINLELNQQSVIPINEAKLILEKKDIAGRDNQDVVVKKIREDFVKQKFKMPSEFLMRTCLITLAKNNYIWLFCAHHSIFDEASQFIFLQELFFVYDRLIHNREVGLVPLQIQYKDFCYWQQNIFPEAIKEKEKNFWKKHLESTALLQLPLDQERGINQTFNGSRFEVMIDSTITKTLRNIALNANVSLYVVLLTIFCCLLYKYSSQNDIVIGTVTDNRKQKAVKDQLKNMVGFLVNTLPFRLQVSSGLSFREILLRAKQIVEESIYEHSNITLGDILVATNYVCQSNQNPLFNVLFVMQQQYPDLKTEHLCVDYIREGWGVSRFDLVLELRETEEGLVGFFEYNSDLFFPETIKKMEKHFKLLTDQVILQLDRKLSEIQIVLEEEKQKIIAWNKTERSYSHVYTVHEMFENMSQKRPSSIALIYDNNTLTYSELDKLSSKFAGYLQTANIQSGAIIGICVERSFNLIIAQLAVLKVGASIVPLETDEQNKHTAINKLKMANCTAVIVDINTQKMFMEHSIKVCILTHEILSSMEFNFNNISVDPFNTALIPFTSGTTGVPKGIVVRHVGWHNWAEVLREYVNEHDKVFYTSPFTFDASFWEIFSLTLAQGATLVMCHAKERIDINALVTLFNRNSVTIATFTPSVLSMLSPEKFPTLRMIFVTGENLPKVLVDKWIKAGIRVINGYGQTEMTAGETLFECTLQSDIYIGKPIANTEILILDENNQLLPINVWGEICVGGLGISQYLGRDDLNKQKFITHPFNSSRKLFRTGDVGRYLHDGTLALKGRIEDQKQIKIYGVRVELEEIEDALTLHPDVQAAAVKVWGERENAFIAAYIVLKKYVPELNEKSIQDFLRKIKALDNLKIPKNFTVLASLPTNSNGKLDKTRLPKPIFKIAPMQDIWRVASKMERDVLEIIKKVFPMLEVSDLNADLVDLGMNSFQVVRMVHLLNQTLLSKQAQKLKVNELIRPITVKEISAIIDKKLKAIPTTNIELDKFAISMV